MSLFSLAEADRSTQVRGASRAMCTNDMFCQTPVFNQAVPSRRAVTVPCSAASGGPGFDTPDGILHVGDYYFRSSTNEYVAYVGAGMAATSTSENPICIGPHFVNSASKPSGMREVHSTGNSYRQHCTLNGEEIYVTITAAEYAALATAHGIPPMTIDPNQSTGCFYSSVIQNNSPRRR